MAFLLAGALATKPGYWLYLQKEWDLYKLNKSSLSLPPALCKPPVSECLPSVLDVLDKQWEEMRGEYRKFLKSGGRKRGIYGDRYIDLPKNLLEKLKDVFLIFKENNIGYNSLSDFVQDAILEHIFSFEDNGELDPIYFNPGEELQKALSEGTSNFIKEVVKRAPKQVKRKQILAILRKNWKNELQYVSPKTLENYISYWRNNRK